MLTTTLLSLPSAISCMRSLAMVRIPPVPQAPSYILYVLSVIWSASVTLFSSLNLRSSSSNMVPMVWLSRAGSFMLPSSSSTGLLERFILSSVNFSMMLPSRSASVRLSTICRKWNLSIMSCTSLEKPLR